MQGSSELKGRMGEAKGKKVKTIVKNPVHYVNHIHLVNKNHLKIKSGGHSYRYGVGTTGSDPRASY